jgi:flagellar hook-associated protein 2
MSISMSAATSYTSGQGIDVTSTVDQILEAESGPETAMKTRQTTIQQQIAMLKVVNGQLSSLASAVCNLRDVMGPLSAQSAISSDSSRVVVSADTNAKSGTHLMEVSKLASTASVYTDSVATDATLSGTFAFRVGNATKSINIDSSNDTLAELATALNNGDYGVTASVLHDSKGDKLVLTSKTAGEAGVITDVTGPSGLSFHQGSAAQDAEFTIDGVPFSSDTNTASGMLTGVTFSFTALTSTPVKVTVGPDVNKATQAIQSFVSAFNTVIKTVNDQFSYDATNQTVGTLSADSSMRVLQSQLLEQISTKVDGNGSLTTLRSLGVNMENDGTLTVDSSKLSAAINGDTSEFRSFFQTASKGFASTFGDVMMKLNNTADGLLYVDINGLNDTNKSIGKQIEAFDARLELRKTSLIQQYSYLDAQLRQMPILLKQISAQLGTNSSSD